MKYLVCQIMTENLDDVDLGLPVQPVYSNFCALISSIETFEDYFNDEDEKVGTIINFFNGTHVITTMPFQEVLSQVKVYEKECMFTAFN